MDATQYLHNPASHTDRSSNFMQPLWMAGEALLPLAANRLVRVLLPCHVVRKSDRHEPGFGPGVAVPMRFQRNCSKLRSRLSRHREASFTWRDGKDLGYRTQ
jgi:hypothetical protein